MEELVHAVHPDTGNLVCGGLKKTGRRTGAVTNTKGYVSRGDTCIRPAGSGTDHPGIGRCKFHGGKRETKQVLLKKYGLQAQISMPEIGALVESLKTDRDIFDFTEHIYVMEALALHMINTGELVNSAKVWAEVTKAMERLHNMQVGRKYVMTIVDVSKILEQFVEIVNRRVQDEKLREVIGEDLARISLPSSRRVDDPYGPSARLLEAAINEAEG